MLDKPLYASAPGTLRAVFAFFLLSLTIPPIAHAHAHAAQHALIGHCVLSGQWVSGVLNAAQLPFHDRFESAPTIELFEPEDGAYVNQTDVTFSGSVDRPVELTIDETSVPLNADLTFEAQISLSEGTNQVELRATPRGSDCSTVGDSQCGSHTTAASRYRADLDTGAGQWAGWS